jgi:hypothetical protein
MVEWYVTISSDDCYFTGVLQGSRLVAALNKQNKYKITVLTPFDYMEIPVVMTKVLATGSKIIRKLFIRCFVKIMLNILLIDVSNYERLQH